MKKKKLNQRSSMIIAQNKAAIQEYFIEKKIEAGLVLEGWEVKSLRAGKVNIRDSYVILKNREAFLLGAHFSPLPVASSHYICNNLGRVRKVLLTQHELNSLYGQINRNGYTAIALSLYWKNAWCKMEIGVAKGKKQHDKRASLKNREWECNKARIMKYKTTKA